jgi:hypothetical protein
MIPKILKSTMILTICVSIWQLWTNFDLYIAYDNLVSNPTPELVDIMLRDSTQFDNLITYRNLAMLSSGISVIFASNFLYNKARAKIRRFDLAQKYSKKRIIGSFFIPFINFVMPRICINELEHILRPDNLDLHESDTFKKRNRAGDAWWGLWIGSIILHRGMDSYLDSSIASTEGLEPIAALMNEYLLGQTIVSILLIVSMLNGVKYFGHLFLLSGSSEETSESQPNPL